MKINKERERECREKLFAVFEQIEILNYYFFFFGSGFDVSIFFLFC